jgi:hypothetical protein
MFARELNKFSEEQQDLKQGNAREDEWYQRIQEKMSKVKEDVRGSLEDVGVLSKYNTLEQIEAVVPFYKVMRAALNEMYSKETTNLRTIKNTVDPQKGKNMLEPWRNLQIICEDLSRITSSEYQKHQPKSVTDRELMDHVCTNLNYTIAEDKKQMQALQERTLNKKAKENDPIDMTWTNVLGGF